MRLSRIAAIVLRQLYLMRGSLSRVLPLFAWVAIDMVFQGGFAVLARQRLGISF